MASSLKNLSDFNNTSSIPNARPIRFGIVVSEWNAGITNALYKGAHQTLLKYGALEKNITALAVPGSFELVFGAQALAKRKNIHAVICLGCVIQGETRHFDFICQAVASGIADLNIKYNKPVIFGVLTTNDLQQAEDRSGGKHGNKGDEAAVTAIKMAVLTRKK
jgi:6,7-dimethyl-8-ribityllumazine synthase